MTKKGWWTVDYHDFVMGCQLYVTDEELFDESMCIAVEGDCVLTKDDDIIAVYPKAWFDRRSVDALCLWFNDDVAHAGDALGDIRPFDSPYQLAGLLLSVISENGGLEAVLGSSKTEPEPIPDAVDRHTDERLAVISRVQHEVRDLWHAHLGRRTRHR